MAHSPHGGQHYHYLSSDTATYVNVGQALQEEPHSRRTNHETNAKSPPNSHALSLLDSLKSQLSQVRPNAAAHLDFIRPHGAMTLSTSLSDKSGQVGIDRPHLVEPDASIMDKEEHIDGPVAADALDKEDTSAPKRMANGQVKPSKSSLQTSPVEPSQNGHSRNSSRNSRGSQIGEVRHLSQYD